MSDQRGPGRPRFDETDAGSASAFFEVAETFILNRSSKIPLWTQLKNCIEGAINNGKLKERSRLPSEQALCNILDVSRPVVRSAIGALASEGLVTRQARKGTFVGASRGETDFLSSNLGVFSDMSEKGHNVKVDTINFHVRDALSDEMRVFGLDVGGKVVELCRVYYVDGKPLTLTYISLPSYKLPGIEDIDINDRSIFEVIRDTYGLSVYRAERWFTAEMPSKETVELMKVPSDRPLIWIESIAYDRSNEALEYYKAFYNSDVAKVHISVNPYKNTS